VDLIVQALVLGVVQGLTEFCGLFVRAPDHRAVPVRLDRPVHHLVAFSVMLHIGTLAALLF
jgi:undecaprenyl pyrophosphate phosphatase UppP